MNEKLLEQGEKYEKSRKHWKRWQKLVGALACIVVFCTTYALILPAITMERTAYCGYEEHTHGEECYTRELTCGYPENPAAQPTVAHQHTDACYTEEKDLICGKEESEGHTHADECKHTEQVLICNVPESEGHTHSDSCYNEAGEMICGKEESEGHIHTDSCYETRVTYVCGKEESEGHTHTDACYETKKVLTCGQEETSGQTSSNTHVHTDACYKKVLTCEKEEHTHTLICYSNPNADVETAEIWERTIPTELSGIWADDVLAVAKSQLGYRESTDNYIVEEDGTTMKGYTRYGAWYGDSYGDWCAMFVSFCLNYAEVPRNEVPIDCNCQNWIQTLSDRGMYFDASSDYQPEPGDLIFFSIKKNGTSDHVGLVAEVNEYTIKTIEGNSGNQVEYNMYDINDARILGYGELPENPEMAEIKNEERILNSRAFSLRTTNGENTSKVLNVTSVNGYLPNSTPKEIGVVYDPETDTFKTSVYLEFEVEKADLVANIPYIYDYPEGVIIPSTEVTKGEIALYDSSGVLAGKRTFIDNGDGTYSVQIVFDQEYVNNAGNKVSGYVEFSGTLDKSAVKDDGSIQLGNDDVVINIPADKIKYPENTTEKYDINVEKQGEWKQDENQLVYTVYVRTTKGTPDPILFTDTITNIDGLILGNPSVKVETGNRYQYNIHWFKDYLGSEYSPTELTTHDGVISMQLPALNIEPGARENQYSAESTRLEYYKITYIYPIMDQTVESVTVNNKVEVSATDSNNHTIKADGKTEITVNTSFEYTIKKVGSVNNNCIKWIITLNENQVDLVGAKLTDMMLGASDDVTVDPSIGYTYNKASGEIGFSATDNGKNNNIYTITYYTPLTPTWDGETVINKATLDPNPNIEGDEKNDSVEVQVEGVTLIKDGTLNGNKIDWEITINPNGVDLTGATLTDTKFVGLKEDNFTISPESGITFNDGENPSFTFNTLEDNKPNTQTYSIKYSTIIDNSEQTVEVKNSANLKPGSEQQGKDIGIDKTVIVEPLKVEKNGYYSEWDNMIYWTIIVNGSKRNIAGAVLEDDMLAAAIGIEVKRDGNSAPENEYSMDKDSNQKVQKITFNAINEGENNNQYTVTYSTPVLQQFDRYDVTNTVRIKNGEKEVSDEAKVTVSGSGSLEKKADGIQVSADGTSGTVSWIVTVNVPQGGLSKNTVIEDNVTKNQWNNINTDQWMTREQVLALVDGMRWLDANNEYVADADNLASLQQQIVLKDSDGKEYTFGTVKDSSDEQFNDIKFTIFTITFPEGLVPPENASKLVLSYETIVDLTKADIGDDVKFYNYIKVGEQETSADYQYRKPGVVKTDGNGSTGTTTSTSDGTLQWKVIATNNNDDNSKMTVVDTLPSNVSLETLHLSGWGNLNMDLEIGENGEISGNDSTNQYRVSGKYESSSGVVTVCIEPKSGDGIIQKESVFTLTINCKVAADLKDGNEHELKNSVEMILGEKNINSSSQTQNWTYDNSSIAINEISKNGCWDNENKKLNYQICLNPEGMDLLQNSESTLTLSDVLSYQSSYYVYYPGFLLDIQATLVQSSVRLFKAVLNEDGTLKIDSGGKYVHGEELFDWSWTVENKVVDDWCKTTTSTITATGIPDGVPLIFEYTYDVTSNFDESTNAKPENFQIPFSNKATLNGKTEASHDFEHNDRWVTSSSSGGVRTEKSYEFIKVEQGNYNVIIPGATFGVFKYDMNTQSYGTEAVKTYTTDENGKFVITRAEKDNEGNVLRTYYEYNTLYKVVETKAPEGYLIPENHQNYYFYFSDMEGETVTLPNITDPSIVPSTAVAYDLSAVGHTEYVENVKNTTEITVQKKWQNKEGNEITHSGNVTINLYRKSDISQSESIISEGEFVKSVTIYSEDKWNYTFENLPLTGTDADGNLLTYYYYVTENPVTSYTVNYDNNDGIQSGTITVNNKLTGEQGLILPETGGHGTLKYIMGGILLMLASVLLYIRKFLKEGRRKHI